MTQNLQFTLRIKTDNDQAIDWMVHPEEITFFRTLEVISNILPGTATTAFHYIDEDGEKITVRSDEELKAMFQMYLCDLSDEDIKRGNIPPVTIYPRVGKTPKDRNRFDLKIKTQKGSRSSAEFAQNRNVQSQSHRLSNEVAMGQPMEHSHMIRSTTNENIISQGEIGQYGHMSHDIESPLPGTLHHVSPGQSRTSPMSGQSISSPMLGQQRTSPMVGQQRVSPMGGAMHQVSPSHYSPRSQSTADNIKQILTCGKISAEDLVQDCLLGVGNGGQVYKTFHQPSQRLMAVKVIHLDVDIEVQKKILLELEILYKCNSPSIIAFYGAFFIENQISICTEFMNGGSLDRIKPIPEDVLGHMAVKMVQGLLYMWSLKILHRDIKPSNILVNTDGEVKWCDFGVSTQLVESIAVSHVGTNAYMAPERIKAENYGAPSEVWSLGVTMYELATGEFPFEELTSDTNLLNVCNSILEANPPVLPENKFSPELGDFVSKCMHKVPQQRITHPDILAHPFIQKYIHEGSGKSRNIIASWVKSNI
ncbi:hypothetical protein ACF0H5_013058 [Mactra antiquata]